MKERLVLAYSGGLDTSVILKWLLEKGYEVITFTANLGQADDFEATKKKALKIGASKAIVEDLRKEFITDYIFPAIKANAKYEGRYLLGTSLARPLTAKAQILLAKEEEATILAHGSTGKGNDQVRFEFAYRTLYPQARIIAPWKDPEFLSRFKGRDDEIEYAKANGIPVSVTKKDPWSTDDNILHISYEAGILEDPSLRPPETMFRMTTAPKEAPDKETVLEIEFKKGIPICIRNLNDEKEEHTPLGLFAYLNEVAGKNGVGRIDMVENRFVGMKSRGVYETPAGTVLQAAHRDLESITLDREVMYIKDFITPMFARAVYFGYWFSPEVEYMMKMVDESQENVTGKVRISLFKGNADIIGRESPISLYDPELASMHKEGEYDPTKARGFIDVSAIRLQAWANLERKKGRSIP
ncbi:MAG: argininosuccinate synthase [Thermoproteota archaeon]|nr:argininosuccinate synthase [Thermoproteota archaeon]